MLAAWRHSMEVVKYSHVQMKVRVLGKGMVQTNRDHGQKRVVGIAKRTSEIILEVNKRKCLMSLWNAENKWSGRKSCEDTRS
jgi:hypothetical protein